MKALSQVRGGALVGLLILGTIIAINTWVFHRFVGVCYFDWYLKNGSTVALGASFVGLIWEELDLRGDLLSAHPVKYLAGCMGLIGILFIAQAAFLRNPTSKAASDPGTATSVGILVDSLVSMIVLVAISIVVIAWLVVIAPLNYFLTLVSGALAREKLRGKGLRTIVVQNQMVTEIRTQPIEAELPKDAIDVSIARKPFVLTQAINSLILWIVSMMLPS